MRLPSSFAQLLCARNLTPTNRSALPNPYAVLIAGHHK
jgi:hypothetical protein